MAQIFGKDYYIDIDGITEKCRIKSTEESDSVEINLFKYELIKLCIERVLNSFDDVDEQMGPFAQNDTGISFKIAFNTLIKNQILIEEDDE